MKLPKTSKKLIFKRDQIIGDIFIFFKDKNHLIAELKDKHLDFRFSIFIWQKEGITKVSLSTIVKINNFFGWIYIFLIKPFHRLIIPNFLKDLSNEIINILKSKRDEIVFKMKLTSKDETDILNQRLEKLEKKIEVLEKLKKKKKIKRVKRP